jgi:uncharacterized protein (TIGR00251 family)
MPIEDNIIIKDNGVLLKLRISPNASKNQIITDGDIIKLKITAQPIEGKANKAVVEYLSKLFKIAKSNIEIVKGDTSKEKTIFINVSDEDKKNSVKQTILC